MCSILPFKRDDKFIPSQYLDPMVGELLGDGGIGFPGKRGNNARFAITMGIDNYPYLLHLRYNIYKDLCTDSKPIPYPNTDKTGLPIQQYWFGTKSLLAFTLLHKTWYINKQSGKSKYTKIVPININEMLKPIGLAHWIMGDGYWNTSEKTVYLCTDNFTEKEVELLIEVLHLNFGLLSTKSKRIKSNKEICWRIRLSSKAANLNLLRLIVNPYMIPEMEYKLGN